jgi:uncharacterized membrane protein
MPRLCGLSDGVFAFALTLLVLDVRLPESLLQSSLPATLTGLLPRLLVYMFSFIVIGGAWGSHQRMLGQILRGDGPLVWLNLFLLFSITLLPACSVLLGRFPDLLISILVFAFDVILIQLTGFLLWRHARAHNLVNEALDPRVVLGIGRRLSISALLFAASLPLFLLSPAAVFVAWVAIALLLFTSDWLSWHQAGRTKTWSVPLSGQSAASIHLKHGAGMLQVTSQPGDQLLEGTFGGGVEASTSTAGTTLEAYLQIPQKRGFMSYRYPWAWGPANSLDWLIHLNPKVPLALAVDSAGGQAALDLGGMTILDLHVRASASSLRILLPPAIGEMTLLIEASLSSCSIVVPADVPARIHSTRSLSNAEIDTARFPSVRHNHEYSSPEFAGAANRIDIALDVGWGSVEVSTGTVEGHAA